jgi:cell division septation protein DedD
VAAPEPPAPHSRAAEPEAESAANPAPAANSAYDYKVVTEYSGDATLEEAQKAIPDAYVRNFSDGARIQLGAFDEAGKAEALAEELEKQGIPAKVEQH